MPARGESERAMPGLTEEERERIRQYVAKPRYRREIEDLEPDEEE